jgi:predicted lipoprotein with Yx(FWY)xxD motif
MRQSNMRFFAVAALAAIALAACSSSSKTSTATTPTTSATTAAPTATTAAGGATTAPAGNVTVAVATTKLGKVLVNSEGMTLYVYDKDPGNGTSKCTGPCLQVWPALTVTGTPTFGPGTPAATAFTVSAAHQLVVNGKPLYTFASDTAPGDVKGQDVGDFYVVGANGKKIDDDDGS